MKTIDRDESVSERAGLDRLEVRVDADMQVTYAPQT